MSNTSNNAANKELLDFLVTDFKEISSKLESTDKKVQFCTQLYITLITAVIAAFGKEILQTENGDGKYLFLFIILLIFYLIGQFVLLYMLSGQKIHSDYVCRLNLIRFLILKNLNKSNGFIEDYGYTTCRPPKATGMNYWMVYLILGTIFLSLGSALYYMHQVHPEFWFCYVIAIAAAVGLNIFAVCKNHKTMKENAKKNDKIRVSGRFK